MRACVRGRVSVSGIHELRLLYMGGAARFGIGDLCVGDGTSCVLGCVVFPGRDDVGWGSWRDLLVSAGGDEMGYVGLGDEMRW